MPDKEIDLGDNKSHLTDEQLKNLSEHLIEKEKIFDLIDSVLVAPIPEVAKILLGSNIKGYAQSYAKSLKEENERLKNKSIHVGIKEYKEARERITQLEEGIKKYGKHKNDCHHWDKFNDCTCGLFLLTKE